MEISFSPLAIGYGVALVPLTLALRKLLPMMLPIQMPGWIMPWIVLILAAVMATGWPRDVVWSGAEIVIHTLVTWVVAMGLWSGGKAAIGK